MGLSVYIIQGTDDNVVDWRYNTAFLERKMANISRTYVKGAKHQSINERSDLRNRVFTAISVNLDGDGSVVSKRR